MIGLDTNVLARYYINDDTDTEAIRQREAARRLMDSGEALMLCKTVLLEFEWVMRGYYRFERAQVQTVLQHLLSLPQLVIEGLVQVKQAVALHAGGFDLADAIHHVSYAECERLASFDDRGFARRAKRLGLVPTVFVPK